VDAEQLRRLQEIAQAGRTPKKTLLGKAKAAWDDSTGLGALTGAATLLTLVLATSKARDRSLMRNAIKKGLPIHRPKTELLGAGAVGAGAALGANELHRIIEDRRP